LATVAKNVKDGSFETMFRNALAAMAK